MRATRLLTLGLAGLVLTAIVGCEVGCAVVHRVQRNPQRVKVEKKERRPLAVRGGAALAVAEGMPRDGIPDAAAWKAAASWDIRGWGRNQEEAEQDALTKARKAIIDHLRRQEKPLRWAPSTSYIRTHLVSGAAKRLENDDQVVVAAGKEIRTECWALPVTITPKDYQAMVRQDRAYLARLAKAERDVRAEERLLLAAKVTGGLLLLIIAVGGYIRLDDLTGGAYTRWLWLGLGALVAAAGVGLWLVD